MTAELRRPLCPTAREGRFPVDTPAAAHRSRTRLVLQGVLSLVLIVAIFYVLRTKIDPYGTVKFDFVTGKDRLAYLKSILAAEWERAAARVGA